MSTPYRPKPPANPYTSGWSAERPTEPSQEHLEGEYLAPESSKPDGAVKKPGATKTAGGLLAAALILLAKFKGILLLLLNFKWVLIGFKLFAFAGTFLLSIWFYALFWGWKFALVFVVLIAVHEFGHYFTMRFFGVPGSLPFFIPGLGALVNMRGRPASAFHESLIAFAGPFIGTLGSAVCAYIGFATNQPFWIAAAYLGFFLNLFNMAPVMPLDGGRIVGSISPRIWVAGLVLFVVAIFAFHIYNPLIWLLILVSLPQVWAAWKGTLNPAYYGISIAQKSIIAVLYFALAAGLLAGMLATHVPIPQHAIVQ
ncbi:MAG: site-2 protease family protein [Candidatus Eremiobacteraeota bacterium]|nr:site-2 protease family protein [Candidatus Eremiobacteraeota bacterium]